MVNGSKRRVFSRARRQQVLAESWESGGVATNAYKARLAEIVRPGMTLLHAGCGWDKNEVSKPFAANCRVVGIDLDPRVATLFHSSFELASLERLPFRDATFDVVFSEYVLEHVDDPVACFNEIRRVLKPGGSVVILTPNVFSYKSLIAAVTPYWFHVAIGRIRYGRGHEADMYPTRYRCNSERSVKAVAAGAHLRLARLEKINNGPTWFVRFPLLFGLGHLYHLLLKSRAFSGLRCALLFEMTAPAAD